MRSCGFLILATLMMSLAAVPSFAAPAPADSVWTLTRCEEAALTVSPVLAGTRERANVARAGVSVAEAKRWPVIALTGRGSYTTETMELNVPTPTGFNSIEFGDGANADLMIGLRTPLFTGGRLQAQLRSAESERQARFADIAAVNLHRLVVHVRLQTLDNIACTIAALLRRLRRSHGFKRRGSWLSRCW